MEERMKTWLGGGLYQILRGLYLCGMWDGEALHRLDLLRGKAKGRMRAMVWKERFME